MFKEATQRPPAAVAARAFIAMGREGFGERFRPCQPGEPPLYNPRSLKHQRSAHERPAAMKLLLENGTEISGRAFGAAHQPSAVPCPNRLTSENGMDRPRSRPQRLSECLGACQGKEHPHASRIHRSRSDRYWNRSRQEHTSYDRSRFVWRHRAAREGLARTHRIEACEPATLPHWHRSRNGDTLCCS